MTLLAERLQRRNDLKHPLARQGYRHFRTFAQFRLQVERSAVQVNEVLHNRQPEAGAAFGGFMRERALAERLQDARDLFLGNTRPGIRDRYELSAVGSMTDGQRDPSAS